VTDRQERANARHVAAEARLDAAKAAHKANPTTETRRELRRARAAHDRAELADYRALGAALSSEDEEQVAA
jgi:hypothetical protein